MYSGTTVERWVFVRTTRRRACPLGLERLSRARFAARHAAYPAIYRALGSLVYVLPPRCQHNFPTECVLFFSLFFPLLITRTHAYIRIYIRRRHRDVAINVICLLCCCQFEDQWAMTRRLSVALCIYVSRRTFECSTD